MKITNLKVENFLRIRELRHEVKTPITMFCGPNNIGKSSLRHAIRFAFTGDLDSVRLKAQVKEFIADGAKDASVRIDGNGFSVERDVLTGNDSTRVGLDVPWRFLPYVLDHQLLSSLDNAARRRIIIDLMGVKTDIKSLLAKLEKGVDDAPLLAELEPALRKGFEVGAKFCGEKATEGRGEWKAVTGETYGVKKADSWMAPKPPAKPAPDLIKDLQASLDDIKAEIEKLLQRKGAASGTAMDEDARKALQDKADSIGDLRDKFDKVDGEYKKITEQYEIDKRRLYEASEAKEAKPLRCPSCKTPLDLDPETKELVKATAKKEDGPSVEFLNAKLNELAKKGKAIGEGRRLADAALNDALVAKSTLESLRAPGSEDNIDAIESDLYKVRQEQADIQQQLVAVEKDADAWYEAEDKTREASRIHHVIKQWLEFQADLSPDGIPAQIAADAVGPFNKRLMESAQVTGWPQVSLDKDMNVLVDGRNYVRCGESWRWRADAMIAEAISYHSKLAILVLDRVDVLDFQSRGPLLKWLSKATHEKHEHGDAVLDTCFLMATVKEKPKMPDTIGVHWMGQQEKGDA